MRLISWTLQSGSEQEHPYNSLAEVWARPRDEVLSDQQRDVIIVFF
jgi:hypothetical protein